MSYGLSFAAIASLIVYTYLNHGKQIWGQFRNSTKEEPDIHMRLMSKYKEAPTVCPFLACIAGHQNQSL